jgi:hypothetical protein
MKLSGCPSPRFCGYNYTTVLKMSSRLCGRFPEVDAQISEHIINIKEDVLGAQHYSRIFHLILSQSIAAAK